MFFSSLKITQHTTFVIVSLSNISSLFDQRRSPKNIGLQCLVWLHATLFEICLPKPWRNSALKVTLYQFPILYSFIFMRSLVMVITKTMKAYSAVWLSNIPNVGNFYHNTKYVGGRSYKKFFLCISAAACLSLIKAYKCTQRS